MPRHKPFLIGNAEIMELSEKVCAVCGRVLLPREIRLIELGRRSNLKKVRYLCTKCRKLEYEEYLKAVKELIEKS
jgi:hypothetical protein